MDNKQNTTWIATVPRTGSMWTFNVVREIINYSKINVLPKTLPLPNEDRRNIFKRRALGDQNEKNHYVFKVHDLLDINIQDDYKHTKPLRCMCIFLRIYEMRYR